MPSKSTYRRIYHNLMERAQQRNWTKETAPCYTENHHIVPRCHEGTDDLTNLARLTAREHFIAHHLLCRIYPTDRNILYAFACMAWRTTTRQQRYYTTSHQFQYLKQRLSEARRGQVRAPETVQKMSDSKKGVPKTYNHRQKLSKARKDKPGVPHTAESKAKIAKGHTKPFYILDPEGNEYAVVSGQKGIKELTGLYWNSIYPWVNKGPIHAKPSKVSAWNGYSFVRP